MGASSSKENQSKHNHHYSYVEPVSKTSKSNPLIVDDDDEVFVTQPKSAFCVVEEVDEQDDEDLDNVEFPYENIVFEGGGSQGNAYVGAVKELSRMGHLKKLRRFGGASIGATTACILSLGNDIESVIQVMSNAPKMPEFLDASCGVCSLVPNIFRHFGWHPGKTFYEWSGDIVKGKLGNPDATFKDLYERNGNELCIVVTNLSLKIEEYCHVKTTPNLPIRAALRMSMSIPGVFYPFRKVSGGRTDLYIDGGLICNYPVHCFDGWWLSLKQEDTFLRRMQPLTEVGKLMMKKERFGTFNEKTIGLIIFSDYDQHVLSVNPELISRPKFVPDTELGRDYKELMAKRDDDMKRHKVVTDAMSKFLKVLNDNNLDSNATINIHEFKQAIIESGEFTKAHSKALFGSQLSTPEEIFSALDVNSDGEIDFNELMEMAESRGVGIQSQIIGAGWTDTKKPLSLIDSVFRTLLMNIKRAFLETDDNERTVMINTAYIKSTDLEFHPDDMAFIIEQGRQGMRSFLRYQKKKGRAKRIQVEASNNETQTSS